MTPEEDQRIIELRAEGMTCREVAELMGTTEDIVRRRFPGRPHSIDNTLLREAFLRGGEGPAIIARRMGWDTGRRLNTSRVMRTLGLMDTLSHGYRQRRRFVHRELAGRLALAIGVEPLEIGA